MSGTNLNGRAFAALLFAFALLWAPLGQHPFLIEHWMKVGTFMAPFLLFVALSFKPSESAWRDPRMLSLLLLLAYIVHQFEEHWVDLLGQVYAFKPFLNDYLAGMTGLEAGTEFINDAAVFIINTSLVWLVAALAIWRGRSHVFASLCMASIVVVNAVSHIVVGISSGGYNPGLASALVVFLPLGIGVYRTLLRNDLATKPLVLFSLIWGVLAHLIMMGGMVTMALFDQPAEWLYFALLIAWSMVPAFVLPVHITGPHKQLN